MKLAVIDPGVFAAGVFWRHEPRLCLKAWLHGILTLVLTEDILAEYEAVLKRVKQEHSFTTDTEPWLDALCASALWVEWEPKSKRMCRDWKAEKFIEAALTTKCQTIIALDPNLTSLEKPFGIAICTPYQWLNTLTRRQRRLLD
jgi:uncharacterized protein